MSRRHPPERVDMVVGADGTPSAFRWRGRGYVVRQVLTVWVEAVPWWSGEIRSTGVSGQRQVWRVEACGFAGAGVYDLCGESRHAYAGDTGPISWRVLRILD